MFETSEEELVVLETSCSLIALELRWCCGLFLTSVRLSLGQQPPSQRWTTEMCVCAVFSLLFYVLYDNLSEFLVVQMLIT